MCGIAGLVDTSGRLSGDHLLRDVRAMTDALRHRGPDSEGHWVDAAAGAALGQRRLSIIDLSDAGKQPMISACGKFVLIYNGEVYNFQELRAELEDHGISFRGHSDTEVVLEAMVRWGPEKTIPRLNGMFAIALWDIENRQLTLALDRFGIKPLYWSSMGQRFSFGSEMKALSVLDGSTFEIDRSSLTTFFRLGYVPSPLSIYCGVRKLSPGVILKWTPGREPEESRYWDICAVARDGLSEVQDDPEDVLVERLEETITDAVRCRLVSDVPIGAFLSGGVDSSTVAAIMQKVSSSSVKTFSIGFDEGGYDESGHAARVARHIGTDHHEFIVGERDALGVVPSLSRMYDEPFADSSQIPTHLVSKLARGHVTVALSGDGGDEVFGGYNRHVLAGQLQRINRNLPRPARLALARLAGLIPPSAMGALGAAVGVVKGMSGPYPQFPEKAAKFLDVLAAEDADDIYRRLVSIWRHPEHLTSVSETSCGTSVSSELRANMSPAQRVMLADMLEYLPGDILTKVDRASMAVSLECRVPLLDFRVVSLGWRLPAGSIAPNGIGKHMLRRVLYRHVPREMIERPKAGFAAPIGKWLRGPLRPWAEELIDERKLKEQGFLDPRPIRSAWRRHQSGANDVAHALWAVLMFQAWLDEWGGRAA